MPLDAALRALRAANECVPRPSRLPSPAEVAAMEAQLGITFHADYRQLLLKAGDVTVGTLEPATITAPASHTHLPEVVASARAYGVPESLFPFCADNGDFYCLTPTGAVRFWSHDGASAEVWPDLATWIVHVWLNGCSD